MGARDITAVLGSAVESALKKLVFAGVCYKIAFQLLGRIIRQAHGKLENYLYIKRILIMGQDTVCEIVTKVQPVDPTFLYYLYSTIAQTLAAAFAFLGAFVLFRLQGLERTCENLVASVMDYLGKRYSFPTSKINILMASSGNWKDFANQLKELILGNSASAQQLDKMENFDKDFPQYRKLLKNAAIQDEIKNDFKHILYLTVIVIFFSIVLLGLVPSLVKNRWAIYIPAILTMLLSFVCLYNYAHIILRVFGYDTAFFAWIKTLTSARTDGQKE